MTQQTSLWVGGAIWLGVQSVDWWLLGRSHDEGSGLGNALDYAALALTVAWGTTLGLRGAWSWAAASVLGGAVWSVMWGSIAYYTDPDPQGESVLFLPMVLILVVEYAALIGFGAGIGALYRRTRERDAP
jgi:hypothetical protein